MWGRMQLFVASNLGNEDSNTNSNTQIPINVSVFKMVEKTGKWLMATDHNTRHKMFSITD